MYLLIGNLLKVIDSNILFTVAELLCVELTLYYDL